MKRNALAPTGRNVIAQGAALGGEVIQSQAPTGRNNCDEAISPRWGLRNVVWPFPGLCPGLAHRAPLGLKRSMAFALLLTITPCAAAQDNLADALKNLNARVYAPNSDEAKELQQQLGKWLRTQRDQVNRRDVQAWEAIHSKEDWEHFRDAKIDALRRSLGTFPPAPKEMNVHVTKSIPGDGFFIENLVYESRPDLWVTANLYCPSPLGGEGRVRGSKESHPGILIIHSHHNPKTQGELQDMGMTWARQGCYVLIPDQIDHGERRQHPFVDAKSYPEPYKTGRQDYFFRYNVAMHLHLVGESLIGWMANDMMRGVDLLYTKPGIDKKAIILLGSVAGGGDPAGVTAALDPRITAVAPFNFGGPQPETKFPLPADAKQSFNYMGGGSWESTRNLRLSGRDGFLPWVIVGSVAPRGLIHAHEFAWDKDRDPVWARYQQIFKFYGAEDKLTFTKGGGSVSGKPPESTHCNNIGAVHRKAIHPTLEKWFGIPQPQPEYSKRVPSEDLQCLTAEVKAKIKFTPVHELTGQMADEDLQEFRKKMRGKPAENQRNELAQRWKQLLGAPQLRITGVNYVKSGAAPADRVQVNLCVIKTDGLVVPLLILAPPQNSSSVVIAVAQEGKAGFLKHRADTIAQLLSNGVTVVLPDLPGCGAAANPGESRGRTSGATSSSATAQILGATMLGLRLSALRLVVDHAANDMKSSIRLWGDSFAPVNAADRRVEVPYDVDKTPNLAEPLGPTLALLAGMVFGTPIESIYTRGGLISFRSILDSQFVYVPHDIAIPGALLAGDLDDLAAAYLNRKGTRLAIDAPVDGLNRAAGQDAINRAFALTMKAAGKDAARLRLSAQPSSPADVAAWLRETAK